MDILTVQIWTKAHLTWKARAEVFSTQFAEKQTNINNKARII